MEAPSLRPPYRWPDLRHESWLPCRHMDMLTLIDQLDEILRSARPVPLTDQVRIQQRPALDLLDRIRAQLVREAEDEPPARIDQLELTQAVSAAIRENIPEIARAVAAEAGTSRPPQEPRAPGAPF